MNGKPKTIWLDWLKRVPIIIGMRFNMTEPTKEGIMITIIRRLKRVASRNRLLSQSLRGSPPLMRRRRGRGVVYLLIALLVLSWGATPVALARDFQVLYDLRVDGNVNTPYGGVGRYENALKYSEQVDHATWIRGGAPTVNADAALAPDGTTTADEIVWVDPSAGTETVRQSLGITGASNTYTISFWIKQGTTSTVSQIRTRFLGNAAIDLRVHSVPSGWERRSFTTTVGAGETGTLAFRFEGQADHGAGRFLVWGAQIEEASSAGVYVKTTASVVAASRGVIANTNLLVNGAPVAGGQWTTSGSDVYYNQGNVGIGTTNPDTKLRIMDATNPMIRVTDTTNTVNTQLHSEDSRGYVGTQSNHDLRIMTNNTAKVTVDTDGKVGIGTTAPTYKLDVESSDNLLASFISTDNNAMIYVHDDDTDTYIGAEGGISFFGGTGALNSANLNINSTGNVGIGTTGPGTLLHLVGVDPIIRMHDTGYGYVDIQEVSGKLSVNFQTVGNAITIDGSTLTNDPRVGIKDATPSYNLDVNGTGRFVGNLIIGGNVGIGTTSPDNNLHIMPSDASASSYTDAVMTIERNNEAYLQFLTPNDKNT